MATITEDTTPVFPACPAYGFTVEPQLLTAHIMRESGKERSNLLWSQALRRYTAVPLGEKVENDIQEILYFWLAVGGQSGRFRFKDYADYKSCMVGDTVDGSDQVFQLTDDSPQTYQLVKQYTFGSLTHTRIITRPIGETIVVLNDSAVEQTDWTLDESTGILTPGGGFSGTPTAWGGEFEVYCRFDSELPIELSNYKIQNLTFALKEVRE